MTKPMYCSMSFGRDVIYDGVYCVLKPMECTPDCAWALFPPDKEIYGCAMALRDFSIKSCNTRPLKDDVDE